MSWYIFAYLIYLLFGISPNAIIFDQTNQTNLIYLLFLDRQSKLNSENQQQIEDVFSSKRS